MALKWAIEEKNNVAQAALEKLILDWPFDFIYFGDAGDQMEEKILKWTINIPVSIERLRDHCGLSGNNLLRIVAEVRTMLFNNREESRDKFMFQLRAFQEIRGTVLDPAQANVYISDIKVACREMIQGLLPGNFDWFSGLFTDLLLQIGLVAVEETDKDVLKQVADKDRLKVRGN